MTSPLVISLGKADNPAKVVAVKRLAWEDFAARFTTEPPVSTDKASQGWYCPAEFSNGHRESSSLVHRYALTFDYDHILREDVAKIEVAYRNYAFVVYTTASHTKDKPRLRVVFPLSRPATLDEFCAVSRKHGAVFDIEKLARESDVPAQMSFLPTKKPDGVYKVRVNPGAFVNVDATLAEYADWRDKSQWPHRAAGDSVHATAESVTPPDEKIGVVGDFCRAFRVPDAIEKFELPYVEGSEGRYTYTNGTRADGMRLYDDGLKAHSENDTDPARGQNNAFDLVRLHKFGQLDTAEDLAKSITERPSYRAMVNLAMEQPELQAANVANEFVDLGPLPDEQPTRSTPDNPGTSIILARPLADVLKTPSSPRWLLRDKLERGVIALMAGPRGSYKSFIGTDWCLEIATTVGPVYVLSAEGADFDRRARAWMKSRDHTDDVPLFLVERRMDLNDHDNVELIRQDCLRLGIRPVMFMLDTFSKLSGGLDENSNTEVKAFIGRLDNGLKRAFDATVLLIAHTGHTDKGRARGASALEADTDAAYIVTRNDTLKNVGVSRHRFKASPELDPLWLEPEVVDLEYTDDDGEPVTSLVMRPAQKPVVAGKGDGMTERQRAAYKTVSAVCAGKPEGKVLSDEMIRALAESMVAPTGRDTRMQGAKRMLQSLIDRGHVYLKRGRVSLSRGEFTEEFE